MSFGFGFFPQTQPLLDPCFEDLLSDSQEDNLVDYLTPPAWCERHKDPWCEKCDIPQFWCSHGDLPSAQCQDCPGIARCGTFSEDQERDGYLSESIFSSSDNSESPLSRTMSTHLSDREQCQTRVPGPVQPIDNTGASDRPAQPLPDPSEQCLEQEDTPEFLEFIDRANEEKLPNSSDGMDNLALSLTDSGRIPTTTSTTNLASNPVGDITGKGTMDRPIFVGISDAENDSHSDTASNLIATGGAITSTDVGNSGNKRHRLERTDSRYSSSESEADITITNVVHGTSKRQKYLDGRGLGEDTDDQQMEEEPPYRTFVIRQRPKPKSGKPPTFTCTNHGDHWHITFQSDPSNKARKRSIICNFLGLSDAARLEGTASTVIIRNIKQWILYLIRYGIDRISFFDAGHTVFKNILRYFRNNPTGTDAVDGPCPYMESKREERREKSQSLNEIDEFEFIDTLCTEKKSSSVFDLLRKLSKQEFKILYGTLGSSYKEKLKAIMVFNNTQKRNLYKGKPFEFILEKASTTPGETKNVEWLEYMFTENKICIAEFLAWTKIIAEEKLNKINTLILQGPTGTGKSLTLNCLIGKLNTGIVTRCGDQNQFHFQNLLNKSYNSQDVF